MEKRISAKIKRRKNFLPTLLLAVFFWLVWGSVLVRIPPESQMAIIFFFVCLFLALFLTTALIFANSRYGFLTAGFLTLLLLFRFFQIGNVLNLIILAGIFSILFLCLR